MVQVGANATVVVIEDGAVAVHALVLGGTAMMRLPRVRGCHPKWESCDRVPIAHFWELQVIRHHPGPFIIVVCKRCVWGVLLLAKAVGVK